MGPRGGGGGQEGRLSGRQAGRGTCQHRQGHASNPGHQPHATPHDSHACRQAGGRQQGNEHQARAGSYPAQCAGTPTAALRPRLQPAGALPRAKGRWQQASTHSPSTSSRFERIEPISEVATTVYSPRCSAAMLRILRASGPARRKEQPCVCPPASPLHAACCPRLPPQLPQPTETPPPQPAHSSTTLPKVALSSPPTVSPKRTARSSVTSPKNSASGMSARKFCVTPGREGWAGWIGCGGPWRQRGVQHSRWAGGRPHPPRRQRQLHRWHQRGGSKHQAHRNKDEGGVGVGGARPDAQRHGDEHEVEQGGGEHVPDGARIGARRKCACSRRWSQGAASAGAASQPSGSHPAAQRLSHA